MNNHSIMVKIQKIKARNHSKIRLFLVIYLASVFNFNMIPGPLFLPGRVKF